MNVQANHANVRGTFAACPRHPTEITPHVPAIVLANPGSGLGPLDIAARACHRAAKVLPIVARACMGFAEAIIMGDIEPKPQ